MEIRIGKPGRECAATERSFEHGETVVSMVKIENQALVRLDFARESFQPEMASSALAVWETEYIDPRVAEQEPEEAYSPLRKLFYDAVESTDRVELAKAFLAAQLLRRQKVFRHVKESAEGDGDSRVALFTDRINNRLIEVRDPNLTFAEMEQGRTRLVEQLSALEAAENEEAAQPEEVALTEHGQSE
ncbi:MAG: hypothetical protein AMXMBFR82_13230 [Candidatus Hydrogenedentota bacterium]